eukprot:9308733-Pyramimonas_sp.AAC.1
METSGKYSARTPTTATGPLPSRTAEVTRWTLSSEPWTPLRETMRPQEKPGSTASTAAPTAALTRSS